MAFLTLLQVALLLHSYASALLLNERRLRWYVAEKRHQDRLDHRDPDRSTAMHLRVHGCSPGGYLCRECAAFIVPLE